MNAQVEEVAQVVGEVVDPPRVAQLPQALPTTPTQMLAMAVTQGASLEKLEKLMDLQDRWEANEARKAYVAAMAAFKAEPIEIRKTKAVGYETNAGEFVGYKHATVADVVDGVVYAMAKHGLSHAWNVEQSTNQVTVTCTITHEAGHRESVKMTAAPDNSGKKNLIQQVASTITYLQRYTLMSATGVAAKDMDDDGRDYGDPEPEPEPQQQQQQQGGSQSPEAIAKRKAQHDAALNRHSPSVEVIKQRIADGDLQGVANAWAEIPQDDQRALWLATRNGGCFTTEERRTIHDRLPRPTITETQQ